MITGDPVAGQVLSLPSTHNAIKVPTFRNITAGEFKLLRLILLGFTRFTVKDLLSSSQEVCTSHIKTSNILSYRSLYDKTIFTKLKGRYVTAETRFQEIN